MTMPAAGIHSVGTAESAEGEGLRWQVPLFLAGLVAVLLAVFVGPKWPPSPRQRVQDGLAEASRLLADGRSPGAITAAMQVIDLVSPESPSAAELHLVLGEAYLTCGEKAGGEEGKSLIHRATAHLDQAARIGVPAAERPHLAYLQALVLFRLDMGEASVRALEDAADSSPEDRLGGYELLIQHHLRQAPPNRKAALKLSEKLLAQPGLHDPNPVRLRQADLLQKLGRGAEARGLLARIPTESPAFRPARFARAWSYYLEGEWKQAAALWTEAVDDTNDDLAPALYYLGICHRNLEMADEAVQAWDRCLRDCENSPAAVAAAIRLAALRQDSGRHDEALRLYSEYLPKLACENPHLSVHDARQLVEAAWRQWAQRGDHERARQLAVAYQGIAVQGEAERLLALSLSELGKTLMDLAGRRPMEREEFLLQARRAFQQAGDQFERAAITQQGDAMRGALLWEAAESYLRAQEYVRAAAVLERYQTLDFPDKRRLEALVGLGEAYRALKDNDRAIALLQQAMEQPGPIRCRARFLLALAQMDLGRLEEAEATLRENVTAPLLDPEPAEFRQSLFALGQVLYRRGQYDAAATYLERAMDRYPTDPAVVQARYWLAESYRQSARRESESAGNTETRLSRDFRQRQKRMYQERSLEHFRALAFHLTDQAAARALAPLEETLLRESRFGIAECLFNLGQHEEAVSEYEALARSYNGKPEGLTALMQLTHGQLALKRYDEARAAITRARKTLELLEDDQLQPPQLNRNQWQQWLEWATEQTQSAPLGKTP